MLVHRPRAFKITPNNSSSIQNFVLSLYTVRPTVPTEVVLMAENSATLLVTWKSPKCIGLYGLKGYIIKYKKTSDTSFTSIPVDLKHCCSYKVTNLKSGVSYQVTLAAIDLKGTEGAPSNITTARTEGIHCCGNLLFY